jgi:hypothetical protein
MAAPDGTTEQDVRDWYGGIWRDPARVMCPPPCRIGKAAPARLPDLAKVA